jgi:hypothetical protein|tara:strand:- start:14 stop:163 length:150 start_codon:yes stop_codon:yes gene_type:complete
MKYDDQIPPYLDLCLRALGVIPLHKEPEKEVRDLNYKPPTYDENGELPF